MSSSNYAPRREDGLFAYVVTTSSWGKSSDRIEWAETLAVAKRRFGWTRQLHTSVAVRRASVDDLAAATSDARRTRTDHAEGDRA